LFVIVFVLFAIFVEFWILINLINDSRFFLGIDIGFLSVFVYDFVFIDVVEVLIYRAYVV